MNSYYSFISLFIIILLVGSKGEVNDVDIPSYVACSQGQEVSPGQRVCCEQQIYGNNITWMMITMQATVNIDSYMTLQYECTERSGYSPCNGVYGPIFADNMTHTCYSQVDFYCMACAINGNELWTHYFTASVNFWYVKEDDIPPEILNR